MSTQPFELGTDTLEPGTPIRALARLYPWEVNPSEELRTAVSFLGWRLAPATVVRGGYGAGLLVGGVAALGVPVVPDRFRLATALGALALGLLAVHGVHTFPRLLRTARRTRALGATPDLVARAVLRMRLEPTPERAATFAARLGEGPLAKSLGTHVRRHRHTDGSGLAAFGEAWADLFPSLRRSCALIEAAGSTPERDRDRLLDRALAATLDGTRNKMQRFAVEIRAPATALYAFGVLLPTALVALLPAAGAAGVAVTPFSVVLVYNLLLPAGLAVGATWLLAHRPVAFPPPDVTPDHPDVPDRRRYSVLAGVGTTALAWITAVRLAPSWGPPIAALGLGCGVALRSYYHPVVEVYERIREAEAALPDTLALVGRRVANGRAVETAIRHATKEVDGEMGRILDLAATQQRQLQVGVREAFLGQYGALADVPSRRIHGSFGLLALATTEGKPAGGALLSLAEHVEELRDIEHEARQGLRHVCRTLGSTGRVFGPMIAGTTVALAETIGGEGFPAGGERAFAWLGATVGWYVLALAILLPVLATGLTRGLDRSLAGYRVGGSLVVATLTYIGSYVLAGTVA